jgi:hypothetical protein
MNRARLVLLVCAITVLFGATEVKLVAQPLSLFREEGQAQRHCRGDTTVWLDFQTRRYYVSGQARYGQGRNGTFTCRTEARRSGYRRSIFGRR